MSLRAVKRIIQLPGQLAAQRPARDVGRDEVNILSMAVQVSELARKSAGSSWHHRARQRDERTVSPGGV
jgi:hypothetical protein